MARRGGSKARIRAFLRSRIGHILTSEEIEQAAGGAPGWARRVRELRVEEWWPIITHNDSMGLEPGEFMMTGEPPPPSQYAFKKNVSSRLRAEVRKRNDHACRMCGAGAGDADEYNPHRKLKLHFAYFVDRAHGGKDELSNLRVWCSTCHQGMKGITPTRPSLIRLKSQIRRATEEDKRAVYKWLKGEYKKKTRSSRK